MIYFGYIRHGINCKVSFECYSTTGRSRVNMAISKHT